MGSDQKIKFTIYRDVEMRKFLDQTGASYWMYSINGKTQITKSFADAKFAIIMAEV